MKNCPACKKPKGAAPARPDGFWEKRMLPLILLRPFRCASCRSRFHRFSLRNGLPESSAKEGKRGAGAEQFSAFLPPEDNRDFQALIEEIGRAEKKLHEDRRSSDEKPRPADS